MIVTCACDHSNYQVCPSCRSFLRESSTLTSVRIMFYPKVNHSQRSSYSCCVQNWNILLFGPKRVFLLREFFQRRCFGKRRISKQKSFLCEEFRRSLMAGGFQDPSPFQQRNQLQWKGEDVIEFCYCRGGEHGQMFGCDDENYSECLKLKVIQNQRHSTVQNVKNGEGASPCEHSAKNRLSQNNFSITSEMCYSFTVTYPPVREITCSDFMPETV